MFQRNFLLYSVWRCNLLYNAWSWKYKYFFFVCLVTIRRGIRKTPPRKFPQIKLPPGESPPRKIPILKIPTHAFKYSHPRFLNFLFFHYCRHRYHWYYLKDLLLLEFYVFYSMCWSQICCSASKKDLACRPNWLHTQKCFSGQGW